MGRASRARAERRHGAPVSVPADPRDRHGELIPMHGSGWSRRTPNWMPPGSSTWMTADGLIVSSSLDDAVLPGSNGGVGPTWIIAASRIPPTAQHPANRYSRRASDDDLRRVVADFGLPAFDEDNHYPGITRTLYCPLDERWRTACECKVTELTVVDTDGYRWTTPDPGLGGCRGCEAVRWGFAPVCPIHEPEP